MHPGDFGDVGGPVLDQSLNSDVAVNAGFGQPGINLPSTSNGLAPVNVLQASPLGTDGYYRPINQADNVFQYSGDLAWERGNQSLRMGGLPHPQELAEYR